MKNVRVLFVHHNGDLDGLCCRELALRYSETLLEWIKKEHHYPRQADMELVVIGAEYGDPPPSWEGFQHLVTADFTYPKNVFEEWIQNGRKVTIFDHHVSAYSKICGMLDVYPSVEFQYHYTHLHSGCEILSSKVLGNISYGVHLLGRYDVWDHSVLDTLHFQYAMRALPRWGLAFETVSLSSIEFQEYLNLGQALMKNEDDHNAEICKEAEISTFLGIPCAKLNTRGIPWSEGNPRRLRKLGEAELFMTYFYVPTKGWKISLRSEKINCAEIASQYGGGGHKGAAGFFSSKPGHELL